MNLKNKKAFTLIELLVVITILAVLAAVAIPSVMGIIQDAQNSAIIADMRSIHTQAIRVNLTTGDFNTVRCTGTPINADIAAMCASIDRLNGTPDGNVISHTSADAFCIQSPMHGGGFRCADHNGHWGVATSVCGHAFGILTVPAGVAGTFTVETNIIIDGVTITLAAADDTPAEIATRIIATPFPNAIVLAVAGRPDQVVFVNRAAGTRDIIIGDNIHTPTTTLRFTLPTPLSLTGNLPRCR